jgi:xylulokinase
MASPVSREPVILAFDHGTSGVKASLITARGRILASDAEKTPVMFLPAGGAEQDPGLWWEALLKVSRRLVHCGAARADDIAAVCVSSTFSSTVAVDRDGNHLMNAMTWMDSRGAPYVRELMKGFPSILGYGLPKVLKWLPKTAGAPTLSGKDDIAHALYIKHALPGVYEKTNMFLPSKDYLNLRLTGHFGATYDSVHLFWLTDIRDTRNIRYDDELIALSGIEKAKLPPLAASTDVIGTLRPDVAESIGLPYGVKVVAGSPDHQCACIGSGAVRDFEAHLYIGTSSWVQCLIPFKKTDVLHSIASFPTAVPGRYQSVNEQDMAGGAFDFVARLVGGFQGPAGTGGDRDIPYDVLTAAASRVSAGSRGVIVTPWLNGERTPVDDTDVRAGIHNLGTATTAAEILRAALEGVAYNTRWSLGHVERFVGRRLDPITIVGGGGNSDLWCRIFADVLDRRIRKPGDPMRANARGAAFIASAGLGEISFEDIPALMEYEADFDPDPANREVYELMYREFLGIYRNNRAMYHRLNRA